HSRDGSAVKGRDGIGGPPQRRAANITTVLAPRVGLGRITAASIGLLVAAFLWGLETRSLPSELRPTSVNYGRDQRTELQLYGTPIGQLRRAPFPGDADRILFVRFARVTPRVGDPQDVIEIRQLGLLVPLVPRRTVLVLATLAISVVLVSPFGE